MVEIGGSGCNSTLAGGGSIFTNPLFWVVVGLLAIVAVYYLVVLIKNKRLIKKVEKQEETIEVLQAKLERAEDGFVLPRNLVYNVTKDAEIHPGKWQIVSGMSGIDEFNVRHNGYVRNFKSGDFISFAEGDTISAVSTNIVVKLEKIN